jgi:hypothetical protein
MKDVFLSVASGTGAQAVDDYNTEPLVGPAINVHKTLQVTQFEDGQRASSSVSFLPESIVERFGSLTKSKVAIGKNGRQLLVIFKSTVTRIIFDETADPPQEIGVEWLWAG